MTHLHICYSVENTFMNKFMTKSKMNEKKNMPAKKVVEIYPE